MYPKLVHSHLEPTQKAWQTTIAAIINEAQGKNAYSSNAARVLRTYTAKPGKFVRPILFLASYTLFSGKKPNQAIINLALSFELLHLYLLIQDDIMDQGEMRRGVKSLHRLYQDDHLAQKLEGDDALFGQNMALLMSDLLGNKAEQLWTQAVTQGIVPAQLRTYFDELKDEVYWGQYLDVVMSSQSTLPSLETIIETLRKKTGEYTLYRPLQIGALLAGKKERELNWLKEYGLNLGIAFQAVDDILGTFGNPEETGKSTDSDIKERKYTPLVYYAFEAANAKDKNILTEYYLRRTKEVSPQTIKAIFRRCDVEAKTRELSTLYYQKSLKALDQAQIDDHVRELLSEFATYILNRTK